MLTEMGIAHWFYKYAHVAQLYAEGKINQQPFEERMTGIENKILDCCEDEGLTVDRFYREKGFAYLRSSRSRFGADNLYPCYAKLNHCEYKNEQFRFPKSKKKRIRKKWAAKCKNWRSVNLGPVSVTVNNYQRIKN